MPAVAPFASWLAKQGCAHVPLNPELQTAVLARAHRCELRSVARPCHGLE